MTLRRRKCMGAFSCWRDRYVSCERLARKKMGEPFDGSVLAAALQIVGLELEMDKARIIASHAALR